MINRPWLPILVVWITIFEMHMGAIAADFLHTPLKEKGAGFILVLGTLNSGDEKKFNIIAQHYNKAAVLFSSPGGNLLAGIEIGQIIRMRNFATGVAPNSQCASACAMAWLGGTKRYMASQSRVGFHAAYTISNGVAHETGLGNAIVGAYVTLLGLPLSAVIYITQSNPYEMTWLSAIDARRVGIDVELLDLLAATKSPPANDGAAHKQALREIYPLESGEQWLIVASRSTLSDALVIAKKYKDDFPETMVVKAMNGQYAITIGRFVFDEIALDGLKKAGRVPGDSYYSGGNKLSSVVWR